MANASVIGAGPVGFTDPTGEQVSIPLSALYFSSESIKTDKWPPYASLSGDGQKQVTALLADLVTHGFLKPAVAASAKPAMMIKAAFPGAAGNNVAVDLTTTVQADPTLSTIDVAVTEKDVYDMLTKASSTTVLGTETDPGSGLVHVVKASLKAGSGEIPDASKPYPLVAPGDTTKKASVDVKDAANAVVFTLEARAAGPEGGLTTVSFSNVDVPTKSFTLTAIWTKTAMGATIGTIPAKVASLGYEIAVAAPPGAAFSAPTSKKVSIRLNGGADGTSPSTASATVFVS